MQNIFAFISFVFVATFTPGPNNIMSLSCGIKYGYKNTLRFIFGIVTGFFLVISASTYINLLLYNYLPKIKIFMSILGFAYMIYLAIKVLKSKPHGKNSADDINKFKNGMLLQFLNPKVILYGITVTSNFIIPYYNSGVILLIFSATLALVAFLATSSWALFGSLFQKALDKHYKVFNITMALLLVYSAFSIIMGLF